MCINGVYLLMGYGLIFGFMYKKRVVVFRGFFWLFYSWKVGIRFVLFW